MKLITKNEFDAMLHQCSAFTDGGNFAVAQGQDFYTVDAMTLGEKETFVVVHRRADEPEFMNICDCPDEPFDFVSAWVSDDPVEAALHYSGLIAKGALDRMLQGL